MFNVHFMSDIYVYSYVPQLKCHCLYVPWWGQNEVETELQIENGVSLPCYDLIKS